MKKNDPFRLFENAEDDFIEKLSDTPRLNDIEKERMFAMSKNIYNKMKNDPMDTKMTTEDGVEGVERYSRPKWYKPLISAAACLVVIAGIAGTASFLKKHSGNNPIINDPEVVATMITSTIVTGTDNNTGSVTTVTESVTTDISAVIDAENAAIQSEISSVAQEAAQQTTAANAPSADNTSSDNTSASSENRMLISRGQQMFEVACRKYWAFRSGSNEIFDAGEKVGEPFYDESGVLHQGVEWTPSYDDNGEFLGTIINDPDIKTIDDAVAKYYETFSERYPDNIRDYFREYNGRVYWYTGQRGGNIFYLASVITEVQRTTDDEIFFTIEHHYDPEIEEYGTGQAIVKETFSVVVQPDGSWKVGQFHLPY